MLATMTHNKACPRAYDPQDDCMCDYIRLRPRKQKQNGSRLTCRAHVRKLALACNPKFRRVGQSFYDAIERMTADHVRKLAEAQRRGVTLK